MDREEIREIVSGLPVKSDAELCRLMKISTNTMNMWVKGERNISATNAQFLRLLRDRPELIEVLRSYGG